MTLRPRIVLLAALAVPLPRALAATYYYTGPTDLALTPYAPDDLLRFLNVSASASSPVTVPAAVVLDGASQFTGTSDIALTGRLTGPYNVTKTGTATLTLAGNNTSFVGNVTVSNGTLRLGSDAALGTSATPQITLSPNGTLDLNGFATPRQLNLSGGALVNNNTAVPSTLAGSFLPTGTYVFGGAGSLTVARQLFSSSPLTKTGPGTVTLAADNTGWSGTVNVNAGTLRVGHPNALGSVSYALNLNPGGALDLNGLPLGRKVNFAGGTLANDNTAAPVSFTIETWSPNTTLAPGFGYAFGGGGDININTNLFSPSAPLIKTGAGTLTLTYNAYVQGAQVQAGTLRLSSSAEIMSGVVSVLPGGTLDLDGRSLFTMNVDLAGGALVNNHPANPITLTQSPNLTFSSADLRFGGAGAMTLGFSLSSTQSLTKVGTGTLTLPNVNNHTGGTTLLAGTIATSHDSQLGAPNVPMTIADGLLRNTTQVIVSRPVTLTGTLGGFDTPFPLQLNRAPAGTGALHKYGTSTLTLASGVNVGPVTVHAGAVYVPQGNVVVTSLAVSPGAVFTFTPTRMFIDVAPGDPLPLDSVRALLLAGRNGGDWLGTGGVTSVRLDAVNDPARTHALAYADGSLLPDSDRQLPLFPNGTITIDTSSVLIRYTLYGDANLDGKLDADDYALLDRASARSLPNPHWTDGDFNYDGALDASDYLLIDTAYLQQQGGTPSPEFLSMRESQFGPGYVSELVASVPEPACLGIGAVGALARRRRRPSR